MYVISDYLFVHIRNKRGFLSQGEKLLVFEIFNKEAIILVGGVSCPVTRVDKVRIICKPPTSPRIMDNGLATVVVS